MGRRDGGREKRTKRENWEKRDRSGRVEKRKDRVNKEIKGIHARNKQL